MMTSSRFARILATSGLSVVAALGVMTLLAPRVEAKPIKPLCGPSYQWSCSKQGGPDFLFIGTVCDKNAYEKKTRRKCVVLGS